METAEKDQYRVVKSRPRAYKSASVLKGLYSLNAVLLGLSFLIIVIPTVLLMLNFVKQSSGSILQFIAGLGLSFFFSLALTNLIALLCNLAIIYLLALGIRKDWSLLTGAISILTAVAHMLVIAFIAFCLLVTAIDSKSLSGLTSLANFIRTLQTENPGVLVLIIFLQTLIAIYFLAFLVNGLGGLRETMIETPLSTFFPSGMLVESARRNDVESLSKIYYNSQRSSGKNIYELWKQLMKNVNLENDVRIARFDENIVGFLITSQNFSSVKSVHLSGVAVSDEAEKCLLRDFVRLHTRSNQYVDIVEVSANDLKLQKALSQNDWYTVEGRSVPRKITFRYGSETKETSSID